MGDDPLAIYKPTSANHVDAAKAMGNFTGWTYAAVNAIASEVANIQLRLYRVNGDHHEEIDDHDLLTLLEGVNDQQNMIYGYARVLTAAQDESGQIKQLKAAGCKKIFRREDYRRHGRPAAAPQADERPHARRCRHHPGG